MVAAPNWKETGLPESRMEKKKILTSLDPSIGAGSFSPAESSRKSPEKTCRGAGEEDSDAFMLDRWRAYDQCTGLIGQTKDGGGRCEVVEIPRKTNPLDQRAWRHFGRQTKGCRSLER
jgi:hypothetical protein